MRILLIVHNMVWRGGGTFYRALHLGRHLVRRGHSVVLLAVSLRERFRLRTDQVDGVNIVESPDLLSGSLRSGWDPWNTFRRVHWLAGRRFDLIHTFESRPVVIFPALFARAHSQSPLVMDWCDWFGRGGSVTERSSWLVRQVLNPVETFFEESFRTRANGTTVINSQLQARAIELGVREETILLLPQGSDVQRIQVLDKHQARDRLGLPQHKFVIGYLGQAFPQDARLLANAFERVISERPDVLLLLIGNRRTDISFQIKTHEAIVETGYVSDEQLNQYLGACDLFWLPLRDTLANRGRWPSKINDYMAAGRPTVATAVGDLNWLFQKYDIGRLAQPEPEEIAGQTLRFCDDALLAQQYGTVARKVAAEQYSWETLTEKLERFYRGVVAGYVGQK